LSARVKGGDVQSLFNDVRAALEAAGRFDHLQHQFNHVVKYEMELAQGRPARDRAALIDLVRGAGFTVTAEHPGLEDGHTLLIVARK
jgi:hypothetical protein